MNSIISFKHHLFLPTDSNENESKSQLSLINQKNSVCLSSGVEAAADEPLSSDEAENQKQ